MKAQYWGDSLGARVPQEMSAALGAEVQDGHVGGDSASQVLSRFHRGIGSGGVRISPGVGNLIVLRCAHPEVMAGQIQSAKNDVLQMMSAADPDSIVCELGQRSSVALPTTEVNLRRRADREAFNNWLAVTFPRNYVPLQTELVERARHELAGKLTQRDLDGMAHGMLPDVLAADSAQDGHMEPLGAKWTGEILANHAIRRDWDVRLGGVNPTPVPIPPTPTPPPAPKPMSFLQRLAYFFRYGKWPTT